MITEQTKLARQYIARYLSGTITNIICDEDIRREAIQDNIDPTEAIEAVAYWQDRLNRAGVNR